MTTIERDDRRMLRGRFVTDITLGMAVVLNGLALVMEFRLHHWSGAAGEAMLLALNVIVWTMLQYSRVWLDAKIRHARADAEGAELMYNTLRRAVEAGADVEVLMSRGGSTH